MEKKTEVNDNEKESFFEKLKDKKYKAKVELGIGFLFILILLIYANATGVSNNYNYGNTVSENNGHNEDVEDEFVLDKVSDNYNYNVDISLSKIKEEMLNNDIDESDNSSFDVDGDSNSSDIDKNNLDSYNINYSGKVYDSKVIINKKIDNNITTYYKDGNEYYVNNGDKYDLIDEKDIFDIIDYKYISLKGIKSYIDKSSLDHTTNYSNGNVSYVYNLKVRDIVKSYMEDDIINIEINEVNNMFEVIIDYSNLLKQIDSSIYECKVGIKYSDIGKIEDFTILKDNN